MNPFKESIELSNEKQWLKCCFNENEHVELSNDVPYGLKKT